jgi:hypothetical protein
MHPVLKVQSVWNLHAVESQFLTIYSLWMTNLVSKTIQIFSFSFHASFFTWWRAPQQMPRTHYSLKAFCATLWWRWRWAVFYKVLQVMEHQWNEIDRGKQTTRRKTCPSATLSTTNPTWTDPGSNPGLRNGRPATNRLSHGTADDRTYCLVIFAFFSMIRLFPV